MFDNKNVYKYLQTNKYDPILDLEIQMQYSTNYLRDIEIQHLVMIYWTKYFECDFYYLS